MNGGYSAASGAQRSADRRAAVSARRACPWRPSRRTESERFRHEGVTGRRPESVRARAAPPRALRGLLVPRRRALRGLSPAVRPARGAGLRPLRGARAVACQALRRVRRTTARVRVRARSRRLRRTGACLRARVEGAGEAEARGRCSGVRARGRAPTRRGRAHARAGRSGTGASPGRRRTPDARRNACRGLGAPRARAPPAPPRPPPPAGARARRTAAERAWKRLLRLGAGCRLPRRRRLHLRCHRGCLCRGSPPGGSTSGRGRFLRAGSSLD